MGCKGSKHALRGGCGPPEPRRRSGRLPPRHSVALRSAALGTLSLDRAAAAAAAVAAVGVPFDAAVAGDEGMMKAGNDVDGAGKLLGPSRSFAGWCPATPPPVAAPPKRQKRVVVVAPRTPNKTPVREPPEEINVWELMKGLDDDDDDDQDEDGDHAHCVERKARSAPGSPVFDPEILDAFRKALDELTPDSPLPDFVKRGGGGGDDDDEGEGVEKREIQMFPGIVRARVSVLQEKINAKTKQAKKASPPPPESAGRVVVYLTSLRGIRQTYEDCWSTSAVLRGYGVRVDERDLSMHAGFKDELRAALGGSDSGGARPPPLPQVFADGRHLGGAEEVRRLHEAGELATALEACDAAPVPKGCAGAQDACGGCGGVRFVPCDACSGSCKVFAEDDDGAGAGAFRRCPECNENGLVRCPVC
ncbi:hypothetical protein C2845_PM10G07710 [Panicum miliaceum]|uniref:Glutaredoxin domain-containing protein n=1 Tax=Panicum miliaceum TaxID=4540 RepID=A0A3L6PA10_PANMI|nr:hypothetical protein C2845_PM10G07710 [Panicum miliaceum]